MINWSYLKLEDICRVVPGGTPKTEVEEYWNGNIAWITPKDLSGYSSRYISFGQRNISKKGLANSSAVLSPIGSILLSTRAPIGYIAIATNNVSTNQGMKALIPKLNTTTDFLFYLIKHNIPNMIHIATGSTFKEISTNNLKNLIVKIPNLKNQKAIANILSSLDDKIELNNKINKNLEELAQILYKRWFVDFEFPNEDGEPYKSSGGEMIESEFGLIPKDWDISYIGELITLVKDSTKSGLHLSERVYVPIDTLQSKKLTFSEHKPYQEANSSLLLFEKFDILIGAMRVYFHKVNLSFHQGVTRTTTFVLRSKSIYDVPFNLLVLNQDSAIDYANGTSKGSTMPYAVWENAFSRYKIINPTSKIKSRFYDAIMPLLQLLNNNNIQNLKLSKLRDELLPKLMNGEIEVPVEE